MKYRISYLPKGNGKYRKIYKVSNKNKLLLRQYIPELEKILKRINKTKVSYAFEKGKNCALNALQHVGRKYVLSMDIQDFFDNIKRYHVKKTIPDHILDDCLIEDSPKQGLPTSPLIATIALVPCDSMILRVLKKLNIDATYTRYADDLIFSANRQSDIGKIRVIVPQILEKFGLKINHKKTKFQNVKNGRLIITGIGVDKEGIHPTRKTKKKIRASIHQGNFKSTNGLLEWSKCKLPRAIFE